MKKIGIVLALCFAGCSSSTPAAKDPAQVAAQVISDICGSQPAAACVAQIVQFVEVLTARTAAMQAQARDAGKE